MLFIGRCLFIVSCSGKNVDTPTSPLYTAKNYTHQSKFKNSWPSNNKWTETWIALHRIIQRMVINEDHLIMSMEKPFPLLVTNLYGLFWFKDSAEEKKKREKLLEIRFLRKWRNVVVRSSAVWLVETIWLEKQHSIDWSFFLSYYLRLVLQSHPSWCQGFF